VVEALDNVAIADVHPSAEILASQTRADLMTTARLVLDHGGDVAAAATALHPHRTTVYFRLSRIQKLTGVDLRDGLARIDFHLALASRPTGAPTHDARPGHCRRPSGHLAVGACRVLIYDCAGRKTGQIYPRSNVLYRHSARISSRSGRLEGSIPVGLPSLEAV